MVFGCSSLFNHQLQLKQNPHFTITSKGLKLFCRDLHIYLKWITQYLKRGGETPKPLPKGLIAKPIDYRFYVQAFELMKRSELMEESHLSDEAYEMVVSYINRFLIDRECQTIELSSDETRP